MASVGVSDCRRDLVVTRTRFPRAQEDARNEGTAGEQSGDAGDAAGE